ncbi:hypothetical protein OXPF_37520 [Oxobacter pfennigii]|uniref:Uncharacterized protein n=1 Tax=Oxobacter pfennigii TaxID=36849 RepID=A0A0P8YSN2_9CLOT|nr:hypothetical protein [Oxobacter pfennigii]KPU42698.1 hypothetical protein OXPF_37520 [Oxobacter pfennigii]
MRTKRDLLSSIELTGGATSDNRVFFRLESYGGEFILVDSSSGDSPPSHWKLRVQNDEWKNVLEEIIALSN